MKVNSIRNKINFLRYNLKLFYLISHTVRNMVSIWLNLANCLILPVAKHIFFNCYSETEKAETDPDPNSIYHPAVIIQGAQRWSSLETQSPVTMVLFPSLITWCALSGPLGEVSGCTYCHKALFQGGTVLFPKELLVCRLAQVWALGEKLWYLL